MRPDNQSKHKELLWQTNEFAFYFVCQTINKDFKEIT